MRRYTGYTGKKSNGEGIERLVFLSGRRWRSRNLGTYADRDKRGKPGDKSVHADYRAADVLYPNRKTTREACDWFSHPLVANALKIDLIVDYEYRGPLRRAYGRAWRCDRQEWRPLKKGEVTGGGQSWARWLHIEIAPGMLANNGDWFEQVWRGLPKPGAF